LEELAHLSVRLVMQAALEAEVSELLGRDRYARGERECAGYRNGHAGFTSRSPLSSVRTGSVPQRSSTGTTGHQGSPMVRRTLTSVGLWLTQLR
jgi:putative transposase